MISHLHFPFLLWDSKAFTLHHLLLIHLWKVCACMHSEVQVQDIHLFRVGRSVQRCPQPVTLNIICSLFETSNFSSGLIALYWDVPPHCTDVQQCTMHCLRSTSPLGLIASYWDVACPCTWCANMDTAIRCPYFFRLEICQKIYTTGFSDQKFYTLKLRNLRLFY